MKSSTSWSVTSTNSLLFPTSLSYRTAKRSWWSVLYIFSSKSFLFFSFFSFLSYLEHAKKLRFCMFMTLYLSGGTTMGEYHSSEPNETHRPINRDRRSSNRGRYENSAANIHLPVWREGEAHWGYHSFSWGSRGLDLVLEDRHIAGIPQSNRLRSFSIPRWTEQRYSVSTNTFRTKNCLFIFSKSPCQNF